MFIGCAAILLVGCSAPNGPAIRLPTPVSVPNVTPTTCTYHGELPDPQCTPGIVNPNVTQANIGSTICKSGWTATIRPPVSYTEPLKLKSMRAYGVVNESASNFEFDHLISLELGGDPTDPKNLWPERGNPNPKDRIENLANKVVCAGRMPLADAQQQIASDWIALGNALGIP